MKIAFLNPPWWTIEDDNLRHGIRAGSRWPFTQKAAYMPDDFCFGQYTPFPHFLAHAGSYTKMLLPDAEVVVRDSVARGESYQKFEEWMVGEKPDWAVLETASASLEHDLRLIRYYADVKWILCGPIDKADHLRIFQECPNVDSIVQGEYDKQVALAIRSSPKSGLSKLILGHDLLTKDEMSSPPYPLWDEDCWDHYADACPKGTTFPQLQMWTSRGCPYKCCFCVFPAVMTGNDPDGTQTRSVRFHSPQWVENYIWDRLSKHKFSSIYLDDDTFNLNNNHTIAISRVMNKIGLPWSAMCRADTIPNSTWEIMKQCGCFGVKLGFESGSQYVIDHIVNKRLDLKKAFETALWLQLDLGINVHTTWTINLPGETDEMRQQTLDTIKRMYDEGAHSTHQLSGTSTIDGTPLSLIAKGQKLEKYDGAIADSTFVVDADGQRKIEQLQ